MNKTTNMIDLTNMIRAYRNLRECENNYQRCEKYTPEKITDITRLKTKIDVARAEFMQTSVKVSAACVNANGKARERLLTPGLIATNIIRLEDKFYCCKKDMNGLSVIVNPFPQSAPKAYKYAFEATIFEARYINGKWKMRWSQRRDTKGKKRFTLDFSNCDCMAIMNSWDFNYGGF